MRKIKMLMVAIGVAMTMVAAPVTAFAGEITDTTDDTTESVTDDTGDTSTDTTGTVAETTTTTTTTTSTASQSDSSLASLGISPGTISPSFSSSVTEYYATLDAGTTEIKVFATPSSSAAGIAWVTGSKTLVDGENTVKVCCGAPNGNATVYIIHVTVGSASSTSTNTSTDTSTSSDTTTDTTVATDTQTETDAITDTNADTTTATENTVTTDTLGDEDEGIEENGLKKVRAQMDSDGNLIYKKKVYTLDSDIPSGDYVSTEKYNNVYEQYQDAKKKNTTIIIIAAVVAVVLIIVIINLIMRIKDKKEELETFYANEPFGDAPTLEPSREVSNNRDAYERRSRVPEPVSGSASQASTPASETAPSPKTAPTPAYKAPTNDTSDDDIEFIDLD